jgi:hypothetical protein
MNRKTQLFIWGIMCFLVGALGCVIDIIYLVDGDLKWFHFGLPFCLILSWGGYSDIIKSFK